MNAITIIMVVALAAIIFYFFIRIKNMIKNAPGASRDMSTKELIKNWQAQKEEDHVYQENLRRRAKVEARKEVEDALIKKYKDEEISRITNPPSFKNKLGLDFVDEKKMERLIGKRDSTHNEEISTKNIFDAQKIKSYAQHGDINQEKIRGASSGVDWNKGMNKGLKSSYTFSGVEKALGKKKR